MNGDEIEKLLRELSLVEESEEGAIPADAVLRAYREGSLSESEAHAVEAVLIENPTARDRLAEISGVPRAQPAPQTRAAVLRRFFQPSNGSAAVRWWMPAAALAAVLLLTFLLWPDASGVDRIPAGLTAEVSIEGYTGARAANVAAKASTEAEAFPETRLTIPIALDGPVRNWMAFGLYRVEGNRLTRLAPGGDLQAAFVRGKGRFEARAETLVGSRAGVYQLFVAVAAEANLPEAIRLDPGTDPAEALRDPQRRQVYPLRLTVLDPK